MKRKFAALVSAVLLLGLILAIPAGAEQGDEAEQTASPEGEAEYVTRTVSMVKTSASKGGTGETVSWDPDALSGKTVSILGDSISSYRNWSNRRASRWSNTTIGRAWAKYTDLRVGMTVEETWWYQLTEDLGLRLLVNNSWSGSTFFKTNSKTPGAYVDRCVQLHDNTGINDGAEPDIIIVYLGTNDFSHFRKTIGKGPVDYDALISLDENGQTVYAAPENTLEAAAICLDRIMKRYSLAEVYLVEMPARGDANEDLTARLRELNADLAAVAEHFGVTVIPTFDGPITRETAELYYRDGRIHPNALGMDVLTEAVKKAILENTAWTKDPAHTVAFELDGVRADYGLEKLVLEGRSFSGKLAPLEKGASFTVSVTMGGEDVTDTVYKDGKIEIPAVTADVTVTARTNE